jgi:hypothetical protein
MDIIEAAGQSELSMTGVLIGEFLSHCEHNDIKVCIYEMSSFDEI